MNHDLDDAVEEKKHANDDFEAQLAKVRDEFAEMSKIAIKEQEELQTKIHELEEELEQAKTKEEAENADVQLESRKKIEQMTQGFE